METACADSYFSTSARLSAFNLAINSSCLPTKADSSFAASRARDSFLGLLLERGRSLDLVWPGRLVERPVRLSAVALGWLEPRVEPREEDLGRGAAAVEPRRSPADLVLGRVVTGTPCPLTVVFASAA